MREKLTLLMMLATTLTHAYRDLETGTFLTRDPLGYTDGPNPYCYVHCNPNTHFDAVGLYAKVTHSEPGWKWRGLSKGFQNQKTHKVYIEIPIILSNQSSENLSDSQMSNRIKAAEERWSGTFGEYEVETNFIVKNRDLDTSIADQEKNKINSYAFIDSNGGSNADTNGKRKTNVTVELGPENPPIASQQLQRSIDHETGHVAGVRHDDKQGSVMADQQEMAKKGRTVDRSRDTNVLYTHISQIIFNRKINDVYLVDELDLDAVREKKKNDNSH